MSLLHNGSQLAIVQILQASELVLRMVTVCSQYTECFGIELGLKDSR